jgi:hypothetical protein
MSHTFSQLLIQVIEVLKKYSLASLIEGKSVDEINEMIHKNKNKVLACDTFESSMLAANAFVTSMTGFSVNIQMFIPNENDQHALYQIMQIWRDKLLGEQA